MKERRYRNCLEERRVELLKEHYDFDEATRTFDIVLHFPKASDIFSERFDLIKKRVMKEEIIEELANLLSDIPKGYKAEFSLVIDDFEGIPAEEILDAFHNVLKFRLVRFKKASLQKYHKVGILTLVGTFLIALMIVGEIMQWWGGEGVGGRLVSYLLDTAGCVFIWEGLYSALLERSRDASLGYMLATRLYAVGLYRNDGSDKAVLSEKTGDVMIVEKERVGKRAGAMFLYLSGFFLLGAGVIGIMVRAPMVAAAISASQGALALFLLLAELASSLFLGGLGFLAIEMFNENYRYFVFTCVAAVIVFALVALSFVSMFLSTTAPANIIASSLSLLAMILFVIGFALSSYFRKSDIKRTIKRGK